MANRNDFIVKNGIVVQSTATISLASNLVTTSVARTTAKPSLDLNFTRSTSLDSRISFSRASSATFVGANGYISYSPSNQPRFDYDPITGQCKGLLIEEFRTNLYTNSSAFSLWGKSGGLDTVIDNAAISPDGYQTASYVNANGTTNSYLNGTFAVASSGTTYTKSIFGKAGTTSTLVFEIPDYITSPSYFQTTFNLATGQITANATGNTSVITPYPNGWYRCSVTRTFSTASNGGTFYIGTYGAGTGSVYLWGAQFEAGYFPTTLIPTGSAQASRLNETCAIIGQSYNNFFNGTQGSFYIEADNTYSTAKTDYPRVLAFCDANSNQNNTIQYIYVTASGGTQVAVWRGAAYLNAVNANVASGALVKAAFGYNQTAISGSFNGSVSQSGSIPGLPTLDRLGLGALPNGNGGINGHIKRFIYWPQKLADAQLQTITS